jgi:hypothetical protein
MSARRMTRLWGGFAAACVLGAPALGQNLILNGSFEGNTALDTIFNMSNGLFNVTVLDATGFGDAEEIDLMKGAPFGLSPVDGDWKLGIHRQSVGGPGDAFAFHLSEPIVAGTAYTVSFAAHAEISFDPGVGPVEIGVSTSATAFGTLVYTSGLLTTTVWSSFSGDFVAPMDAAYLTVRPSASQETWAHVDKFSLTVVPAPAAGVIAGGALLVLRRRRV